MFYPRSLESDTLNGKRMLQLLYEKAFYPDGTVALDVPDERYNKLNVKLDRDLFSEDYMVSFEFEE